MSSRPRQGNINERCGQGDLVKYMDILSDVRRAAVLICDSIRIREDNELGRRRFQPSGNPEEAPRCPVCILEYKDPTIVISVCGHGMHKECAETLMEKNDIGNDEIQRYICPLCRASFLRSDVISLVNVVPTETGAIAWRSVQLAGFWKAGIEKEASADQTNKEFRELSERLYKIMRVLFRNSNDLSCAIGGVLERFEEAIETQDSTRKYVQEEKMKLQDMKTQVNTQLDARAARMNERERKLLEKEYQNGVFITQCLRATKREEGKQIDMLEDMDTLQQKLNDTERELERTRHHLKMTQRVLEIERSVKPPQAQGVNDLSAPVEAGPSSICEGRHGNRSSGFPPAERTGLEVIGIGDSSEAEDVEGSMFNLEASGSTSRDVRVSRRKRLKRVKRNYRIE